MSKTHPKRRERLERGIYRTASGSFEIGWTDASGKQRWRIVHGGITAARRALAEEHARRGRGEQTPADPRMTFEKAAGEWKAAKFPKIRPRTRETYGGALTHLLGHFNRRRLATITVNDVARYVSDQEAAGLKGWTIRGHLTVLGGIFTFATRRLGFVGTNPVALLDGGERPDTRDARPRRSLTPGELERLLAAVDDYYRLIFETAAETGARLGEVLGLTWADVDTDAGSLTFAAQLDRTGGRVSLKTERARRCIEVSRDLTAKLREARMASSHSEPGDLVFLSRSGTPHDHRNIAGRVLARAVKRAQLDGAEAPTFHTLRHSHASALIAQGWDLEEVSARLGHANPTITLNTYVHEFDAARRSTERRARLDELYGRPMEGTDGSKPQQAATETGAKVADLREKRTNRG